jgi:hypothetical protein
MKPEYKRMISDEIFNNALNDIAIKYKNESYILKILNDEKIDKFRNIIINLFQNNEKLTKDQIFKEVEEKIKDDTLLNNIYATITSELATKSVDFWIPKTGVNKFE